MPIKIFTLKMNESGVFDDAEIHAFSQEFQVLNYHKDFFVYENVPTLAIFLEYRQKSPVHPTKQMFKERNAGRRSTTTTARKSDEATNKEPLTPNQEKLFETLRKWRNQRAIQEGRQPINVLLNAHLEDIVRLMPRSSGGLQQVSGIGPGKAGKYGPFILSILHNTPVEEIEVLPDGTIRVQETLPNADSENSNES